MDIDILYSPSEVCEQIKVKDSTLRKYVIILEGAGYKFSRNKKGHRQYTDKDIIILKRFIAASQEPGIRLETAAEQIVSTVKNINATGPNTTDIAAHTPDINISALINHFEERESEREKQISLLLAINSELIERLEATETRENRILSILEGMELRELEREEAKKAAAIDPPEPETKKNFLTRLFSK